MYSTNFPRRITPWRRRRPYQHVLCALRTLGRTEQVSAEIQEDRRNRSRLHLHDIRISLQVLSTSISRRTHSGSTNNPIQFHWCSVALWLEEWGILPSHDYKRIWTTCAFCEGCEEDRHHRVIRLPHRECHSRWIVSIFEWTPQTYWHQNESHQLLEQALPRTPRLERRYLSSCTHSSSKQRRSQVMPSLSMWDSSNFSNLRSVQRISD